MSETPPASSSSVSTPPSSASEQARIRKERREAKIKAGGSARLNKITGLGGGVQREPPPQPASSPSPNPAADPEEVDISQHFYQPASTSRPRIPAQNAFSAPDRSAAQLTDEQLRAMMLGFPAAGTTGTPPPPPGSNPFSGFPGMDSMGGPPGAPGAPSDDPMLKLLQQMMGGAAPGEGPSGMPSFPGMPAMGMPGQAAAVDPYAYLWRIVHAVFALGLGLYIGVTTDFTGTKLQRDLTGLASSNPDVAGQGWEGMGMQNRTARFFWIFATVEVVLQTSRFFLEKGKVQVGGIIGMVMGLLPQPFKGYLMTIMRYGRIWTTVSADAMVCVFVLGVCSWLRIGDR